MDNNININEMLSEGSLYLNNKKYEMAIDKYNAVLIMDPDNETAYLQRGISFYNMEDFSRARDDFSNVIALNPGLPEAYEYRGWSNMAMGAIDRALNDFSGLIEKEPSSLDGYYGRAWCNANKAQWDHSSLLYLYQRFESDAGLFQAYKDRSWNYVKQMQWELAVAPDNINIIVEGPDIYEIVNNIGFCCFKKAQWEAAIRDMERAIAIDPNLDRDKWNREWAIGKKQSWDLPIADYYELVKLMSGKNNNYILNTEKDDLESWYYLAMKQYRVVADSSNDNALIIKANYAIDYIDNWRREIGR